MTKIDLDRSDHALLSALINDSTKTNAELSELVNLSPSQCSRRRARLEQAGVIMGYGARINEEALGIGLRAVTRVNLISHNEATAATFASMLARHEEVESAWSVSGDADYVLIIKARDLKAFAEFVHESLLPHADIAQVRSEIVLLTIK